MDNLAGIYPDIRNKNEKIQIKTQKSEKYLAIRCSCGIMTENGLDTACFKIIP